MMVGYHNQPGKTSEAEWHSPDGLRFIRTGDVGRFDEDGFLTCPLEDVAAEAVRRARAEEEGTAIIELDDVSLAFESNEQDTFTGEEFVRTLTVPLPLQLPSSELRKSASFAWAAEAVNATEAAMMTAGPLCPFNAFESFTSRT